MVWISSLNGLIRFDGVRTNILRANSQVEGGLVNNNIQSPVFDDQSGRLWFNSAGAIYYYEQSTERIQQIELHNEVYKDVQSFDIIHYDDVHQRVWLFAEVAELANHYALLYFSTQVADPPHANSLVEYQLIDTISHYYSNEIVVTYDKDSQASRLIFPTANGWEMRTYTGADYTSSYRGPTKPPKQARVYAIHSEGDILWLGTDDHLYHTTIVDGAIQSQTPHPDPRVKNIRGIVRYDDTRLLVATQEGGMFLFDTQQSVYTQTIYTSIGGYLLPFQQVIEAIHLDGNGNLWVLTEAQGVFFTNLYKKRFDSHLQQELSDDANYSINSITEDLDGNIWCIANNNQIIVTDQNGVTLPITQELANDPLVKRRSLYYIESDATGNLWLGTNMGLNRLRPNERRFSAVPTSQEGDQDIIVVPCITNQSNGSVLLSSFGRGLFTVDANQDSPYLERLPGKTVETARYTSIFEHSAGQIIAVEMQAAIHVYDQKPVGQFFLSDSIPFPSMVSSIVEDPVTKEIWIGSDEGLFRMYQVGERFEVVPVQLPINYDLVINSIQIDNRTQLWIGTNRGLVAYRPDRIALQSNGSDEDHSEIRTFSIADGLQGSEFNFWSSTITRKGDLVFGGTNGFNSFHPDNILPYEHLLQPSVTRILVNGEDIKSSPHGQWLNTTADSPSKIRLRHSARTIRFDFASSELTFSGLRQFEYELKDTDGKLILQGQENYLQYANPAAGKYYFELRAFNSENHASGSTYHLEVQVDPHWTGTTLFRMAVLLLILALGYWYYISRVNRLKKNQRLIELDAAIERIKMNPHFIFNSLSSIREYIHEQNIKVADKYLMHLARLMRKILETSYTPYCLLKEEIQLLEDYLKAEEIRFENRFTYTIELDPKLDIEQVRFPSMLLQPFVENAIQHGFRLKKKDGVINISFKEVDGFIECKVIDNGTGRSKSERSPKAHPSRSTQIARERLRVIEEKTGKSTRLNIIDLQDDEHRPVGTIIHLVLPFL